MLAFVVGWLVEWALIRHLYKRPLDTLLATWGLSLVMQQTFRSVIGPKEVSPTLPDWLMGSWAPRRGLDIPINGLFVLALTPFVTVGVLLALYSSRAGACGCGPRSANRAMASATGINTKQTDRLTFAIGCGIAGVAGAAFTTIGSTGPTSGLALHRRRLPRRHLRRRGQPARHRGLGVRHRADAVDLRVLPDRLDGQGAHAAR